MSLLDTPPTASDACSRASHKLMSVQRSTYTTCMQINVVYRMHEGMRATRACMPVFANIHACIYMHACMRIRIHGHCGHACATPPCMRLRTTTPMHAFAHDSTMHAHAHNATMHVQHRHAYTCTHISHVCCGPARMHAYMPTCMHAPACAREHVCPGGMHVHTYSCMHLPSCGCTGALCVHACICKSIVHPYKYRRVGAMGMLMHEGSMHAFRGSEVTPMPCACMQVYVCPSMVYLHVNAAGVHGRAHVHACMCACCV